MKRAVRLSALAVLGVLGGKIVVTTPPARADCITASVWIDRCSAPTSWIVPTTYCMTTTPWNHAGNAGGDFGQTPPSVPPGTPCGAGADVGYVSPAL